MVAYRFRPIPKDDSDPEKDAAPQSPAESGTLSVIDVEEENWPPWWPLALFTRLHASDDAGVVRGLGTEG
jgi:hypothetical protein